jgi:hypothetical protein
MHKSFFILLIVLYVFGCTPKLSTSSKSEVYSEDVSAFRPEISPSSEEITLVTEEESVNEKGNYVPPTHDINSEMSVIMDSITAQNKTKLFTTFTIQVYTGRSREDANLAREKVYRVMPDEKPSLSYKQPSYKVNVGKYFDTAQAYKTLTILKESFPGATLVPERDYASQGQ